MPNILIVDDNVVFVVELEETLSDLGYQVAGVASTGFEAIQMAKEVRPDLVLMDIEMPGEIDGISAARNILAEERIPIIFLTGHVEEELLQRASRVTTDGYIVKPFHDRQLLGAMEVALRKNENHENSPKFKSEKLEITDNSLHLSLEQINQIKLVLSPAEHRVAKLVKRGKSSQEIAEILNLSSRTVEWHRMNIRKKLGINDQKTSIYNYLQFP